MVFCEYCGGLYGAKTWHSTSKYKRVVWKCNHRYEVEHPGKTPTITDEMLQGELEVVTELMTRAIEDNKTSVQDQDEYWAPYNQLEERYTQTAAKLSEVQELLARRQACGIELGKMRKAISGLKPDALDWDEALFHLITDRILIAVDGQISVELKSWI